MIRIIRIPSNYRPTLSPAFRQSLRELALDNFAASSPVQIDRLRSQVDPLHRHKKRLAKLKASCEPPVPVETKFADTDPLRIHKMRLEQLKRECGEGNKHG